MGQWRRVVHNGSQLISVEHRADEYELGAAAYTNDNLIPKHIGLSWFVQDIAVFDDAEGLIPWEALSVSNPSAPSDQRTVSIDVGISDSERQKIKDQTRGAGGMRDSLELKLRDNTITDAEIRDLLRLERGL